MYRTKLLVNNNKIGIILTCTVNTGNNIRVLAQTNSYERKNMYIKSIKQWLNKTNFIVVVIENSGYKFPELNNEIVKYKDRFEILSYTESELPKNDYNILKNDKSKGTHEIYAINYAYNWSKLLKDCDFIIKVTGRYFIPDLIKYNFYGIDFVHQNNIQRCEILGCSKQYFDYLFHKKLEYINNEYDNDMIEVIYKRRIEKLNKNNLRLPLMEIEPTRTGSTDTTYTYL
jgi:hypothetical protein